MKHVPWGPVMLIGGLLLVFATDVPSWIGWLTTALGVAWTTLTFVVALFVVTKMRPLAEAIANDPEQTQKILTNFGRVKEVKKND